ncbi:MAG: class I SAM-dependent RNA methyltransferase [Ignavibacteria bacterium]|jgi:putative N6-adenine-specific DNA methylase|nr:class I SAM-dependent RNA methyltransferase [Ignavibacteria bacterium]MCU7504066.1 class I SAM-dependent RNA methyltransferase [Ignavibacteria bacterium]MCU7518265.1 class I SAM-dependent RNA methyltransferase [Ignavibacteria bacterium]
MSILNEKRKILVSCPQRISPILKEEVSLLGYPVISEQDTFVETLGNLEDAMRLNLFIRTGHRVLLFLEEFPAANPDALYKGFYGIKWEDFIEKDGYISVSSYAEHESVKDTRFPNLKAKDAIVDRFRDKFGKRPDSGSERKGVMIYFYWVKNHCSVFFDTSGVTLTKRNYRKIPFKAPMQEALAAAVLIAAGWKGEGNFVNPMCGSGTLAIEAALMGLDKAPGLLRSEYAFMHLKGFDREAWAKIRHEARLQGRKSLNGKIIATDISREAIRASIQNAKTAGVDHLIEFKLCDFRDTEIPMGGGTVLLNPEYGERLGKVAELEEIYKGIGDFFKKKCLGYKGYVFTGNFDLAKKIGLRTKRRIPFFNGNIDCRLLEYELYEGSRKPGKGGSEIRENEGKIDNQEGKEE